MTVDIPVERPRRHWGWWLLGLVFILAVFTAGRLVYPKFRQQQLIKQLKASGFTFNPRGIRGDWREAWVQHPWLPQSLRNAYKQELVVSNPPGKCGAEDFALLTELVTLDEEWFHSPSRCWMSLYIRDLTDRDLIWLQPRVQHLRGSGAEITDDGMAPFQRTPHLETLSLDAKQIGDRGLVHLSGLKSLVRLSLNGQHITDTGLVHLAGLTQLEALRLEGTRVTDAGLVHLTRLSKLRDLELTNSQVTGSGLDQLIKLPELGPLILNGNPIVDASLVHFRRFPALWQLQLRNTKISDLGVPDLRQNRLAYLDLSNTAITDAAFPEDEENWPISVFQLNLRGTKMSAEKIRNLQKKAPTTRGTIQHRLRIIGP